MTTYVKDQENFRAVLFCLNCDQNVKSTKSSLRKNLCIVGAILSFFFCWFMGSMDSFNGDTEDGGLWILGGIILLPSILIGGYILSPPVCPICKDSNLCKIK